MTSSPVSRASGAESVEHAGAPDGGESTSSVLGKARQTLTSSGFAGMTGGLLVLRGIRAVRRGKRLRGIARIAAGGLLLATVYRQRQSSAGGQSRRGAGVDEEDVVDTSPDVGHVDDAGIEREEHASGEAARDVAESSVDVEDVNSGAEETNEQRTDEATAIDFETGVDEPGEGVGAGTFDAQRGVPVPQPAFEEGFLDLDGPVYWAIRDRDDAVFVSRDRAVFEESDGVEYVTSTEVDDEQILSVPDVILDHWEGVDDSAPVSDADELVFATSDDLRWVDVLWIVSEHRTDEFDEL